MRKLLFVTGTRADFGKLKPLLRYVENLENIELHLIVTGMHMMKAYGSTYLEVLKENFTNVYLCSNQYFGEPMSSVFGNTVNIFTRTFSEIEPDMVIIHGDRLEALAGATVGALNNRLVCHLEGGELSGTIDDSIRHAISKLSHIHLVANDSAKDRLIQMGENEACIYVIGSPDLDVMNSNSLPSIASVKEHYQILFDKFAISLFHPVTTEYDSMEEYSQQYFQALIESGDNFVVIFPNNDIGTEKILGEIDKVSNLPNFRCFPSVRFESFLVLLKSAEYVIGNSSAGIREAPFYGIPTINVGTRQNNRSSNSSIINTDYSIKSILEAIDTISNFKSTPTNMGFGDGTSVQKFAEFIEKESVWDIDIQKSFIDL